MILKHLKRYWSEIKESINDLKSKKTWHKQIPNILTFMRLVFSIPAGLLFYINPVASIIMITFLWLTDAVDGKIARKYNLQSKLGADMDTIADKLMFLGSSIPLLTTFPIIILNLLLEIVISGINVYGRMKNINTKTVKSGKIKTISLALMLVLSYVVQFIKLPMSILEILMGFTTCLQLIAIKDYLVEFKKMNNELKGNTSVIAEEDKKIFEDLPNKEYDTLLQQLKREREFLLGTQLPSKVYTGKKRIRLKMKEKKND